MRCGAEGAWASLSRVRYHRKKTCTFLKCTKLHSTLMIDLQIIPAGSSPIFQQIVDQIAMLLRRGELSPGAALPSVRALAERLVVNPNTVARAYSELIRAGLLEAQRGRGVFVAQRRELYAEAERERRLTLAVDRLVNEAAVLGSSAKEVRCAVEAGLKQLQRPSHNEAPHA
jgi:GntR family transcriptional regulator